MSESSAIAEARESANRASDVSSERRCVWWVGGSAFVSWWLYVMLAGLSRGFTYQTPGPHRPLISVLSVFAALFGLYIFQTVLVTRNRPTAAVLPVIVVFACAFRLLLLFSEPIQEVDIYRYLWDGKVATAGVSPFRYSPEQILTAKTDGDHDDHVARLVSLRDRSPANAQILSRVHFGELTSVYPPISQAVFALAASITPDSAPLQTHVLVMKALIVAFDLATLYVLIALLKYAGKPAEWSVIYAWCPLVMKEFANSGHLDSIAVFLTVATIYCAVRAFFPAGNDVVRRQRRSSDFSPRTWTFLAAAGLALGIGAKIYPIVFAPLLFLSAWKRVSRWVAMCSAILVAALAVVMIAPMLIREPPAPAHSAEFESVSPPVPSSVTTTPPVPTPETAETPQPTTSHSQVDPHKTGLEAFAGQWQMNDFLFLIVFENLKPPPLAVGQKRSSPPAWFAVTSATWRTQFVDAVCARSSISSQQVPFLAARLLTAAVFLLLALWFGWHGMQAKSSDEWLQMAFLTIAWFWLLQPTQNPWYWTWALPLVTFSRSRVWLAMSGLTLIYYGRFWFAYHAEGTPMFGTHYTGIHFFDLVVTWIEFGPWFVVLIWATMRRNKLSDHSSSSESATATG